VSHPHISCPTLNVQETVQTMCTICLNNKNTLSSHGVLFIYVFYMIFRIKSIISLTDMCNIHAIYLLWGSQSASVVRVNAFWDILYIQFLCIINLSLWTLQSFIYTNSRESSWRWIYYSNTKVPTRCTCYRVYFIWRLLYMFLLSLSSIFRSTKQL
jgi:hypothetical protein